MIKVLRSSKVEKSYTKRLKEVKNGSYVFDFLKLPLIKKWQYWILVKNEFPYDKIAKKHDLLVPKRFIADGEEMEDLELNELYDIKTELNEDYDAYYEGTKRNRTVPEHFHIHCIEYIQG